MVKISNTASSGQKDLQCKDNENKIKGWFQKKAVGKKVKKQQEII